MSRIRVEILRVVAFVNIPAPDTRLRLIMNVQDLRPTHVSKVLPHRGVQHTTVQCTSKF